MSAPWQSVQLNFRGGIDQKTVAEYVDPNERLLDVLNGVFTHDGAIEKRPGMQALGTNTLTATGFVVGSAAACFSRGAPLGADGSPLGAQLLATDGDGLYSYSPGVKGWAACDAFFGGGFAGTNGRVSPCTATRRPMITGIGSGSYGNAGPTELAVAEGNGVRAVTFRTTGSNPALTLILYDLPTGAYLSTYGIASGASFVNAIPIITNGTLFVFYADSGHIYCWQLNLTTLSTSTTTLVSNAANAVYDATPETNGSGTPTGILVGYNQASSPGRVTCLRYESLPSLTLTASFQTPLPVGLNYGAATVISCRVDVSLGIAYVAWENPGTGGSPADNLLVVAYNVPAWTQLNIASSTLPFQPTIPGYTQGGSQPAGFINIEPLQNAMGVTTFLVQCIWGTSGGPYPGQAVYNTSGTQLSSVTYPYGFIAGRPFRATVGGVARCYVPFCFFEQITTAANAYQFATLYLMDTRAYESAGISPYPRIAATLAPRQTCQSYYASTMQTTGAYRPPLVTSIGNPTAGTYRLPIALVASEEWQTSVSPPQPVLVQLATYNFSRPWSYSEGNNETYFAGGVPQMYASQGINELGFHLWPSRMTPTQGGSGNLTPTSTYGYAFVFSEVDAAGLIHRSAAYTSSVTLIGGNNQVIWTIPGIPYTQRGNAVVEVYRTAANGSTYYYVGEVSAYGTGITGNVTFTDGAADTSITSNTLLYTTGGVVQSVNPPSFQQMIRHVERLWGLDDTGLVVWFSTPFSPSDAPWFNEALTLQFTDETLNAIWSMDDKALFFSATHIWYVEGVGPNNLGQGSDLTQAVLLPSDVGCASWQSLVTFPGGVLFQAPSGGIYMLDRGLSVSFVGKEVQDITNGAAVVSAQLVSTSNHVRFVLSTGIVLTFDYVLGRWGRMQLTAGVFGTPLSAAMVGGVWSAACSSGMVAQEKPVVGLPAHCYQDSTAAGVHSFVPTTVKLAHLRPGGLDGWAQLDDVQGRADWLDPADILMTLSYDYGAASQGPDTFTYASLHGAQPSQARWKVGPQAANCMASAVQVTLSDAAPTGGAIVTGQGMRWLGITVPFLVLGDRNLNMGAGQSQ